MLRWWFLSVCLVTLCNRIVISSAKLNLRGNLTISTIAPWIVRFNSDVNGTCEVYGEVQDNFNISRLRIHDNNGTALPAENLKQKSERIVEFVIPKIQRNQFGTYKCVYHDILSTTYIHVLAEPLDVTSLQYEVNNWKTVVTKISPSLKEQDRHTHDPSDKYSLIKTVYYVSYAKKCPTSGNKVVVKKGPNSICQSPSRCCDYACNCAKRISDGCLCNYNDLPGLSKVITCFGVKVWTKAFGEPNTYDKVFQVDLEENVKPVAVVADSIQCEVINSTSVSLSWREDGMWTIRGKRRVRYCVTFEAQKFEHVVKRSNLDANLTESGLKPHGQYKVSIVVIPIRKGFPSDASSIKIMTMPDDVPSKNPTFIGYSEKEIDDRLRKVTIFWKPLEEIDKNGNSVVTEVEVDGRTFCRTSRNNACSGYRDVLKSRRYHVKIYSRSKTHGRNNSAPVSIIKISGMRKDFSKMDLHVSRTIKGSYNVTWNPPREENVQVSIVMCEKNNTENECSAKKELSVLGQVDAANGSFIGRLKKGAIPYKIGAIMSKGLYGKLVEWSPCVYEEGKVPHRPLAQVDKRSEELLVHVGKYKCDAITGCGVRVSRIRGRYCQTSDDNQHGCNGDSTSIEFKDSGKWMTYDVAPGMYEISLQAESEDGQISPEWTATVDVPSKGLRTEFIVLPVVAVIIPLIIGFFLVVRKKHQLEENKVSISLPSRPPVKLDLINHDVDRKMAQASLVPYPSNGFPIPVPAEEDSPRRLMSTVRNDWPQSLPPNLHKPAAKCKCNDYAIGHLRDLTDSEPSDCESTSSWTHSEGGDEDSSQSCGTSDNEGVAFNNSSKGEHYVEATLSIETLADSKSDLPKLTDEFAPLLAQSPRHPKLLHKREVDPTGKFLSADTPKPDSPDRDVLDSANDDANYLEMLNIGSVTPNVNNVEIEQPEHKNNSLFVMFVPKTHEHHSEDSSGGSLSFGRSISENSADSVPEGSKNSKSGDSGQSSDQASYVRVTVDNPALQTKQQDGEELPALSWPALHDRFQGLDTPLTGKGTGSTPL